VWKIVTHSPTSRVLSGFVCSVLLLLFLPFMLFRIIVSALTNLAFFIVRNPYSIHNIQYKISCLGSSIVVNLKVCLSHLQVIILNLKLKK